MVWSCTKRPIDTDRRIECLEATCIYRRRARPKIKIVRNDLKWFSFIDKIVLALTT